LTVALSRRHPPGRNPTGGSLGRDRPDRGDPRSRRAQRLPPRRGSSGRLASRPASRSSELRRRRADRPSCTPALPGYRLIAQKSCRSRYWRWQLRPLRAAETSRQPQRSSSPPVRSGLPKRRSWPSEPHDRRPRQRRPVELESTRRKPAGTPKPIPRSSSSSTCRSVPRRQRRFGAGWRSSTPTLRQIPSCLWRSSSTRDRGGRPPLHLDRTARPDGENDGLERLDRIHHERSRLRWHDWN